MTSRLRFSVLFGVLLLLATASASSSSSRPPEVYSVIGHEAGRAAPAPLGNDDDDGTQTTLSEWAMRQRFYVGGFLEFKLAANDSLLLVRQADYERCSAASPLRRFADGGDTRFTLDRPGVLYFISGTPARCEAGERMVVRVVDPLSTSGAAPTTAPGTELNDTVSTRRRRPLTIAEKQMVAGAIGFAAGFVTTFLIVALFICCPKC